jgi:hypothetical protein
MAELRATVMRPDLERLNRYDSTRVRQRFLDAFAPEYTRVIQLGGHGSSIKRADSAPQPASSFRWNSRPSGKPARGPTKVSTKTTKPSCSTSPTMLEILSRWCTAPASAATVPPQDSCTGQETTTASPHSSTSPPTTTASSTTRPPYTPATSAHTSTDIPGAETLPIVARHISRTAKMRQAGLTEQILPVIEARKERVRLPARSMTLHRCATSGQVALAPLSTIAATAVFSRTPAKVRSAPGKRPTRSTPRSRSRPRRKR